MKFKLAIFDMDGTILNSLEDLADSINAVLAFHDFPTHTIEEIRFFVGDGVKKLVERSLPKNSDEETKKMIFDDFVEYYKNHSAIKTKPYDGILELLQKLKNQKILTAVNTNKIESAAISLCNQIFPNLFDFISGNREGVPVKPSPDGVFEIIKKAGVKKEETVFIGDSDVDLQTGINAGIEIIGVDWGFRGKNFLISHGAKKIAIKPSDILNFLE